MIVNFQTVLVAEGEPEVWTLCGSSRFKVDHEAAQRMLSLEGKIVIPMGLYGHVTGLDMSSVLKKNLDWLHFRKIDKSHGIYVVNPEVCVCSKCEKLVETNSWCKTCFDWAIGIQRKFYIGESTRNEIEYAKKTGKQIRYLNPVKE